MIKNKNGFTLVELLVTIAIIGLLSTLATVSLNSARTKARDAKRKNDMNNIMKVMQVYYTSNDGYPVAAVGAEACGDPGIIAPASESEICHGVPLRDAGGDYINTLPQDPVATGNLRYFYDGDSDQDDYCIEVDLEASGDGDADDWFVCRNGTCQPSMLDCDGALNVDN
jgi:prepilin-type N-terminal cleavage/methylation domain-containing protein